MVTLTKREFLMVATGSAAAALMGMPAIALGQEKAAARVAEFLAGATAKDGGFTPEMPEIAENGNTVPLTVRDDAKATEQSYVESMLIIADGNPEPGVATFHFSPLSGVQEASTRMRLAKTQNVIAVAKMYDGSFMKTEAPVKVTIGGCGG